MTVVNHPVEADEDAVVAARLPAEDGGPILAAEGEQASAVGRAQVEGDRLASVPARQHEGEVLIADLELDRPPLDLAEIDREEVLDITLAPWRGAVDLEGAATASAACEGDLGRVVGGSGVAAVAIVGG